jgi:hypothetical protein
LQLNAQFSNQNLKKSSITTNSENFAFFYIKTIRALRFKFNGKAYGGVAHKTRYDNLSKIYDIGSIVHW